MCLLWQPGIGKLESFHAVGQAQKGKSNLASNVINLLNVNLTDAYHIKGLVNLHPVDFMLDTGAVVSLLNAELWNRIKGSCSELVELHRPELVGVGGAPIRVHGITRLNVDFNGKQFAMNIVVANLGKTEAIVGLDFLEC